jgi:hypothetical protein
MSGAERIVSGTGEIVSGTEERASRPGFAEE